MRLGVAHPSSATASTILALYLGLLAFLYVASVIDEIRFASERIGIAYIEQNSGLLLEWVELDQPADRAGLQVGDLIVAVNGQPAAEPLAFDREMEQAIDDGSSLSVEFLRDSDRLEAELQLGADLDLAVLIAQFVLVSAYLGLTLIGARYRRDDFRARLMMIFVGLITLEVAMPLGYSYGDSLALAIALAWPIMTGAQLALELHLVSLIPGRLPLLKRFRWIVPGFYAIGGLAAILLSLLVLQEWSDSPPDLDSWWAKADILVMSSWAASVTIILAAQILRTRTIRERQQAAIVLLGLLPWLAYVTALLIWTDSPFWITTWASLAENLILLIFPIAVFLAIFRYGLFSVGWLVRRSLVYSIAAVLLMLLLYGLLTEALPWVSAQIGDQSGLWLTTGMAVILGLLFRPLRNGVARAVERGLFPQRRTLRKRLVGIASELSMEPDAERLLEQMTESLRDALGLQWVAATIQHDRVVARNRFHAAGLERIESEALSERLATGSRLFDFIASRNRPSTLGELRRRLKDATTGLGRLGADAFIPLRTQDRTIGVLCLSVRSDGSLFTAEDLELLDLFSHQVATQLDNLKLFQHAKYESLTGLLRREVIMEHLIDQSRLSLEHGRLLAVVMLDLDHFKQINDNHGHLFGDQVLEAAAHVMRTHCRSSDAVGRFGGEEFLLVLPDTDNQGATRVAETLTGAIAEMRVPTPETNETISISASAGVAVNDTSGHEDPAIRARELLNRADQALYRAKRQGRNCVVLAH